VVVALAVGCVLRPVLFGGKNCMAALLRCTLGSSLLYPISSLGFTAYLLQFVSLNLALSILPNPKSSAAFGFFTLAYFLSLGLNLLLAFPLSLLVEKPLGDLRHKWGCARKRGAPPTAAAAAAMAAATAASAAAGGGGGSGGGGGGGGGGGMGSAVGGGNGWRKFEEEVPRGGQHSGGSQISGSVAVGSTLLAPPDGHAPVTVIPRRPLTLHQTYREGGGEVRVGSYEEFYHPPSSMGGDNSNNDNPFR
jgi:hypothetical protein